MADAAGSTMLLTTTANDRSELIEAAATASTLDVATLSQSLSASLKLNSSAAPPDGETAPDEAATAEATSSGMDGTLRSVGALFSMTTVDSAHEAAPGGHVWFNSPLNSTIPITPYSQVYGMHPQFFNFGEGGTMLLTPVAHMLERAGMSNALKKGPRARSCTPRSGSKKTPPRSNEEQSEEARNKSPSPPPPTANNTCHPPPGPPCYSSTWSPQLADRPPPSASLNSLPLNTDLAALLRDRQYAFSIFQQTRCSMQNFEENKVLLKERIEEAKALNEEVKAVRSMMVAAKTRLQRLRADREGPAAGTEGTSTAKGDGSDDPEELANICFIDGLKAKFQDKTWELWRVKSEVDKTQREMEEAVVRIQWEFETWLTGLRKKVARILNEEDGCPRPDTAPAA